MAIKFTNPLNNIKVASPCSANWEEMNGNARQRFCGQCEKNVYNLSAMTKDEAEKLIMNTEGRLCARFYRRSDGTILTKDCPVGWKALKRRMSKTWTAVASLMFTAIGSIGITAFLSQPNEREFVTGKLVSEPLMGDIAVNENSNSTYEPEMQPTMGNIATPEEFELEEVKGAIAIHQK